jgi:hypothetical protein
MSQPHHTRDHSTWAASSTAANWLCAGRIAMASMAGEEKESIYAARGTATHEVCERSLREGKKPADYFGEVIKTKEHAIEVDEDIVKAAEVYVDYVLKRVAETGVTSILLEQRYSLEKLDPPFDSGGTADAVLVIPKGFMVEVIDGKFGTRIVEVGGNKQLRTYALLTLLNLPAHIATRIKKIKSTIVQPRAHHADGFIRSEEYHVADLMEWGGDLLAAMGRSKEAFDEFQTLDGNRVMLDEWSDKWLSPCDVACAFCPALGFCPARRKKALAAGPELARRWFEDLSLETPPVLTNTPMLESEEELAHTLDGLEALEDWIAAVRQHAHARAERGDKFPGWQLVEKIGNRTWIDEKETIAALKRLKLKEDQIYSRKLVSPAQADKVLGAKRKASITKLYERPVRGTNLVSVEKTDRPAVPSLAERFFEE